MANAWQKMKDAAASTSTSIGAINAVFEAARQIADPTARLQYLQSKKIEIFRSGQTEGLNAGNVAENQRLFDRVIADTQKEVENKNAEAAAQAATQATSSAAGGQSTSGGSNATPSFTIPTPGEATQSVRDMPEIQKIQQAASTGLDYNNVMNSANAATGAAFNPYQQAMASILEYKAPTVSTAPTSSGIAPLPDTSSKLGFDLGAYLNANANVSSSAGLPAPPAGVGGLPSAPSEVAMPTAPTIAGMTEQPDLAGIKNKNLWETSITPEVQAIMKSLGRSGAESSSYGDRLVADMIASEYGKWQGQIATLELQRAQQEVADKLGLGQLEQQSFATKTSYANSLNQTRAQNYSTATSGAVGMANVAAQNYATAVSGAVGMANVEASRYATTVNAANQARALEIQETLGLGELDIKRRQAADASAIASYTAQMNATLQASELSLNAMTAALQGSISGGTAQIQGTAQAEQNYMQPYLNQIQAQLSTLGTMNTWYANQYTPLAMTMGTLGIGQ